MVNGRACTERNVDVAGALGWSDPCTSRVEQRLTKRSAKSNKGRRTLSSALG